MDMRAFTERKFKVGDVVVARYTINGLLKGDRYHVTGIDSSRHYHWVFLKGKKNPSSCDGSFLERLFDFPWRAPSTAYKVGDIVEFTDACPRGWWFGPHTPVKTGTIIGIDGVFGREYRVRVGNCGNEGTVNSEHIKLVAPRPVAIVALIEDGQPKPSASPHVHRTTAGAKTEAERLSKLHPGKQFGVYELIAAHTYTPPPYKHEWQRKAKAGDKIEAIRLLRQATDIGLRSAKDAVEDWLRN